MSIPLIMQQPGNRPAVEVTIDGKGPYTFLVETGAHTMDISPKLAATLELPRQEATGIGPSSYHVNSVGIGGATFEDLNIYDMPPVGGLEIQGVLGLSLFQNVLLTINYPKLTLRLERGSLPAANGKDILPLTRVSGFWGLPISMPARSSPLCWIRSIPAP